MPAAVVVALCIEDEEEDEPVVEHVEEKEEVRGNTVRECRVMFWRERVRERSGKVPQAVTFSTHT